MNISTNTISKSTSTSSTSSASTVSSKSTSAVDEKKSFKDELVAVQEEQTSEQVQAKEAQEKAELEDKKDAETNTDVKKSEEKKTPLLEAELKELGLNEEGGLLKPLQDLQNQIQKLKHSSMTGMSSSIDDDKKIDSALNYQSIKMSDNDAKFFINLVENAQFSLQQKADGTMDLSNMKADATSQAASVSQTLINSLTDAMKNSKSVRIDFDKDVAVILKVDKQGTISANFIPGDKAVEDYLRNNIPMLKQRFEEQNLPYNELSHRKYKQQNNENNQNNKENKDE